MRIKRLYEADDVQQLPMNGDMPQQPQMPYMAPPAPVATSAEMMPDFTGQEEPEQMDQEQFPAALPQPDVMNLTVQELMDRCESINPLVCMGLRQFIDLNRDALLDQTTGDSQKKKEDSEEVDLNFSKQMEPKAPEFSLDQPAQELDFPQE